MISFKENSSSGRFDVTIGPKQNMGKTVEGVVMTVHMPKAVLNMNLTATQGSYTFDPVTKVRLNFEFIYLRGHYSKSYILQSSRALFHTSQEYFPSARLWIKIFSLRFTFPVLEMHQVWFLVISGILPLHLHSCKYSSSVYAAVFCWCFQLYCILQAMLFKTYLAGQNAVELKTKSQTKQVAGNQENCFHRTAWRHTGRETEQGSPAFLLLSWGLWPEFPKASKAF